MPKDIHELRSFMGLAEQLASFVPDLAHTTEPIRQLQKKERAWFWGPVQQKSFEDTQKY